MKSSKFEYLRLSPEATEILDCIFRYVERYQRSPDILDNAASDVMDGWKLNSDKEVQELRKKKILVSVKEKDTDGSHHTWVLTEYGQSLIKSALEQKRIRQNEPQARSIIQEFAKHVIDTKHAGVTLDSSELSLGDQMKELRIAAVTLGLDKTIAHLTDILNTSKPG